MKKFQRVLLVAVAIVWAAGMVSCSSDIRKSKGVLMTEQGDIDLAVQFVAEYIPADAKVTYINFLPDRNAGVTLYVSYLRVYYFEKDSQVQKVMLCPLTARAAKPSVESETDDPSEYPYNWPEAGVAFSEIDFSKIAGYVERAGKMVVAASDLYEKPTHFSGIGSYEMTFTGDPKNAYVEFSIESKDVETSTETRDDYFLFDFEVKNDQLISKDELEETDATM